MGVLADAAVTRAWRPAPRVNHEVTLIPNIKDCVCADVVIVSFDHDSTTTGARCHHPVRPSSTVVNDAVVDAGVLCAIISTNPLLALIMHPVMVPFFGTISFLTELRCMGIEVVSVDSGLIEPYQLTLR